MFDGMYTPACYQGESIAVRPVRKSDGSVRYAIYRPWNKGRWVIDEFSSLAYANAIAAYIDANGGSLDKNQYRAAKKFADTLDLR
jgi:hypothetical protein